MLSDAPLIDAPCWDSPKWYDSTGDGCSWYKEKDTNCENYELWGSVRRGQDGFSMLPRTTPVMASQPTPKQLCLTVQPSRFSFNARWSGATVGECLVKITFVFRQRIYTKKNRH